MGVLSAFCVGLATLVINGVVLSPNTAHFKGANAWFIIAGLSLAFLAAFLFYQQRSHLAWLYGQICISIYRDSSAIRSSAVDDSYVGFYIEEADKWEAWTDYQQAFICLFFSAFAGALGTLNWIDSYRLTQISALDSIEIVLLALYICCLQRRILRTADKVGSDYPYMRYFRQLKGLHWIWVKILRLQSEPSKATGQPAQENENEAVDT